MLNVIGKAFASFKVSSNRAETLRLLPGDGHTGSQNITALQDELTQAVHDRDVLKNEQIPALRQELAQALHERDVLTFEQIPALRQELAQALHERDVLRYEHVPALNQELERAQRERDHMEHVQLRAMQETNERLQHAIQQQQEHHSVLKEECAYRDEKLTQSRAEVLSISARCDALDRDLKKMTADFQELLSVAERQRQQISDMKAELLRVQESAGSQS